MITSVTAPSANAGINVLDYLKAIQRNQVAVKENSHINGMEFYNSGPVMSSFGIHLDLSVVNKAAK